MLFVRGCGFPKTTRVRLTHNRARSRSPLITGTGERRWTGVPNAATPSFLLPPLSPGTGRRSSPITGPLSFPPRTFSPSLIIFWQTQKKKSLPKPPPAPPLPFHQEGQKKKNSSSRVTANALVPFAPRIILLAPSVGVAERLRLPYVNQPLRPSRSSCQRVCAPRGKPELLFIVVRPLATLHPISPLPTTLEET